MWAVVHAGSAVHERGVRVDGAGVPVGADGMYWGRREAPVRGHACGHGELRRMWAVVHAGLAVHERGVRVDGAGVPVGADGMYWGRREAPVRGHACGHGELRRMRAVVHAGLAVHERGVRVDGAGVPVGADGMYWGRREAPVRGHACGHGELRGMRAVVHAGSAVHERGVRVDGAGVPVGADRMYWGRREAPVRGHACGHGELRGMWAVVHAGSAVHERGVRVDGAGVPVGADRMYWGRREAPVRGHACGHGELRRMWAVVHAGSAVHERGVRVDGAGVPVGADRMYWGRREAPVRGHACGHGELRGMRAVVHAGSAVHERGVRVDGANLCTRHRALHRRRRTPAVHRRAQRSVPLRALRKRLSGHAAQVPRRCLYLIARGSSALTAPGPRWRGVRARGRRWP